MKCAPNSCACSQRRARRRVFHGIRAARSIGAPSFRRLANWLPDEEAAQLRFAFEAEIRRLEAA
jgi:hypothetical protein